MCIFPPRAGQCWTMQLTTLFSHDVDYYDDDSGTQRKNEVKNKQQSKGTTTKQNALCKRYNQAKKAPHSAPCRASKKFKGVVHTLAFFFASLCTSLAFAIHYSCRCCWCRHRRRRCFCCCVGCRHSVCRTLLLCSTPHKETRNSNNNWMCLVKTSKASVLPPFWRAAAAPAPANLQQFWDRHHCCRHLLQEGCIFKSFFFLLCDWL